MYSRAQQNLIPNPGFEEYVICPTDPIVFDGYVKDWRSFHYQPSYYNKCGQTDPWGVEPYEGRGFIAMVLFTHRFNVHWRYIQVRLQSELVPNTQYYLEFQAYTRWASFQIGTYQAYFSNAFYLEDYGENQLFIDDVEPQFNSFHNGWDEFDKWVLKSGCFEVREPSQYMMFGNFNGNNTDTFAIREDALQAFIRLDNFALYEVNSLKSRDTILCPGEILELNKHQLTGLHYIFNGDTLSDYFSSNSAGNFIIEQHLDGCGWIHSFEINIPSCDTNCYNLPDNQVLCPFDTLILPDTFTYKINQNDFDPLGPLPLPGDYEVIVSNSICDSIGYFNLSILKCEECVERPQLPEQICLGDTIILPNLERIHDLRILVDGHLFAGDKMIGLNEGNLMYNFKSDICDWNLSFKVDIDSCAICDKFYIPQAFSPNGDGINDYFQVYTPCEPYTFSMKIFDRWGVQVFECSNIDDGWHGNMNGIPLHTGVYIYLIKVNIQSRLEIIEHVFSGELNLMR